MTRNGTSWGESSIDAIALWNPTCSDRLPQSEGPQKLSTLNGHSPSPTVVLAARESGKNSDNVEYGNSFSIVSKGRNGSTILGLHHGIDCLRVVRLIIRFVHV